MKLSGRGHQLPDACATQSPHARQRTIAQPSAPPMLCHQSRVSLRKLLEQVAQFLNEVEWNK
jgi:hypothetical protein